MSLKKLLHTPFLYPTEDVDGLYNEEHHLHSNGRSESPLGNQPLAENEGAPGRSDSLVSSEEDAEVVKKWSTVMGPSYEIKVHSLCVLWCAFITWFFINLLTLSLSPPSPLPLPPPPPLFLPLSLSTLSRLPRYSNLVLKVV